jgi:hypothetical protein
VKDQLEICGASWRCGGHVRLINRGSQVQMLARITVLRSYQLPRFYFNDIICIDVVFFLENVEQSDLALSRQK